MDASHSSPAISLLDLPPELVAEITRSAYIGKSTHFVFRRVCKATAELVPTISADSLCTCAAAEGHLDILKWGYENGYKCVDSELFNSAISAGHLDVLKWLRSIFKQYHPCYGPAADNGHLHILQYGFQMSIHMCGIDFVERAAQNGHLNVVEWLWNHGHRSECAIKYSAAAGHLPIVQYLYERTNRVIYGALCGPIRCGYIEIIEYLCGAGYTPHSDEFRYAVLWGRLEVLKWFHQNGYTLTGNLHDVAATNQRTEIAEWLRTVGY